MRCRTGAAEASADGHGLSPEPNPSLASPDVALAGGCQEPGSLRIEAEERNNVARTTILHACSTALAERTEPDFWLHPLRVLCGLCGYVYIGSRDAVPQAIHTAVVNVAVPAAPRGKRMPLAMGRLVPLAASFTRC
jgi:hypothetical protein